MGRAGRPLNVPSELTYIDQYIENNDIEGIKYLTKSYGIDCYDQDQRTFLIISASKGNIITLKYLIDEGADLDFQDKIGYSALHFACQNKHLEILNALIASGCNINTKDIHGNPPIWTAIFNAKGDNVIVKKLLEEKADITSKNNYGKSPSDIWKAMNNNDLASLITK